MLKMAIIGQAARGDAYLPRPQITEHIWDSLSKGANVLLAAPRRVGKSSLLFDMMDNPQPANMVIYYTSESVNSENEYYKKLFHHVVDRLERFKKSTTKAMTLAKDLISRIDEISVQGSFKIGESKINYLDQFQTLLDALDLTGEKLLVLNDELSSTVENIIKDESERSAIHFLQTVRELRQLPKLYNKVQFVYAGSIGLENIVSKLNCMNEINDLVSIAVPPFSKAEAVELVNRVLKGSSIAISSGGLDGLLSEIEWLIPYYIQILLDESYTIIQSLSQTVIDEKVVNEAVRRALKHRLYFEHWFLRLRKAYQGDEFSFVKAVLNLASENKKVTSSEVVNIATLHKLEDRYHHLLNALKYDGYLNNEDDPKIYRFNSPLLREWWRRNVAN